MSLARSQRSIERKVELAADRLGGQFVKTARGVPRVIFDNVTFGGTSVVWFNRSRCWRVFEPDPDGPGDGQRRTDFKTLEEVESHLKERS